MSSPLLASLKQQHSAAFSCKPGMTIWCCLLIGFLARPTLDSAHTVQIPLVPIPPASVVPVKQQSLPNLSELFLGKENIAKREG